MPSNYESFGLVALEAMACGTPVIATQVGGLQHLVKDGVTGFTIPHNNPDALEEKISQLICNSELRDQLKQNCVEYARTYAWEVITAKIVHLYRSMIQSSGGGV
jgi:D-inositol-3-phosphate glycosyltransferase